MGVMTSYDDGQFSWVDLVAHDLNDAVEFYTKLFGWHCNMADTQGGPPYGMFQLQGKDVAGVGQMMADMKAQGMPPYWNSYVNVDDIEAVAKKTSDLGGQVVMPVMQVMEAGWLAYIQDPTGGTLGLWQKNQHFGAGLVNVPHTFCWNEFATRDIEKAKDFFGQLFGWEFADNPKSPTKYYIIKNKGKENGGLMQMDERWGEMPPAWMVYFTVESAEKAVAKVSELGGKVVLPPFDIVVGRMAIVSDPQGGTFTVIKMFEPIQ